MLGNIKVKGTAGLAKRTYEIKQTAKQKLSYKLYSALSVSTSVSTLIFVKSLIRVIEIILHTRVYKHKILLNISRTENVYIPCISCTKKIFLIKLSVWPIKYY